MRRSAKKPLAALRYAIYLRCSTDDQAEKDFSTIEVQREINRAHVEALGGTVVHVYTDDGISGTTMKRPGLAQLIEDARARQFDCVCVTYMSRLGRGRIFDIAEWELSKHGVTVALVKEKFTDDLAGYMGKTMTTMMDGVYPLMVSQWTRTKMEAMVAKGFHCGGITPFGYKIVIAEDGAGFRSPDKSPPKRIVPDERFAPFAKQAFLMAGSGASLSEVARYLETASERKWTSTSVHNMIALETYIGRQVFGEWRNDNAHPAIITPAEWEAAQVIHGSWAKLRRNTADSYEYYLRGYVWCPHCQCLYTQAQSYGRSGVVHYYICQSANRKEPCPVGRVNADALHEALFEEVRRAASRPTTMRAAIDKYGEDWQPANCDDIMATRGPLAKRKQYLEMQIGNYTRAIGEGRALDTLLPALETAQKDRDAVVSQLDAIDKKIAETRRVRPTLEQMCRAWSGFMDAWDELPDADKALAAQALVRRVVMKEKERATVELESIPLSARSLVRVNVSFGSGYEGQPEPRYAPTSVNVIIHRGRWRRKHQAEAAARGYALPKKTKAPPTS